MSEQRLDPADETVEGLNQKLKIAREELELLRYRVHSVELAFYEHELQFAKAKKQLRSPLYRVYAGTYRLLLRPLRPLAVRLYKFEQRYEQALHRKLGR